MINLDLPTLVGLRFDPQWHTYSYRGRRLPSISKVTRQFLPVFDRDGYAARIAKKRGITPAEVIAEWDAKRDASVVLGEEVHTAINLFLLPETPELAVSLDMHLSTMSLEAHERFGVWVAKVSPRIEDVIMLNGVPAIEQPVNHLTLGYAGKHDLFAQTKAGIWYCDWKTNGEYNTENRFGDRCLAPFDDLPACEHVEYSIQGSLNRMALESHGVETAGSFVAWMGPEGQLKVRVGMDLRERLTEALTKKLL